MKRILMLSSALLMLTMCFASSKNAKVKVDGNTYEIHAAARWASLVKGNKKARNVVVPNEVVWKGNSYPVTRIGRNAFANHSKLVSVTIPKNVNRLEGYCFSGCSSLKNIQFQCGALTLYEYVFQACSSLTSINLPKETSAYQGINNYGRADGCFNLCSSLKEIELPKSFDMIGASMFNGCKSLERIVINNTKCSIYGTPFATCTSLKSIEVLYNWDGVSKIDIDGYRSENGILFHNTEVVCVPQGKSGDLVLPKTTTAILSHAFEHCRFSSVTLSNVKKVDLHAFWPSTIEQLIVNTATPPVVVMGHETDDLKGSFMSNYIKKLVVPRGSKSAYQKAAGWRTVKVIEER